MMLVSHTNLNQRLCGQTRLKGILPHVCFALQRLRAEVAITTILFFHLLEKSRNNKYCSTITTVYYVCATFRAKNGPQNRPYIGVKIENMSETWFSALEIISFYQKIEFPRNTRSSCTLDQRSPGPKKVRQSIIILEDSEHPNFTKLFFYRVNHSKKSYFQKK